MNSAVQLHKNGLFWLEARVRAVTKILGRIRDTQDILRSNLSIISTIFERKLKVEKSNPNPYGTRNSQKDSGEGEHSMVKIEGK